MNTVDAIFAFLGNPFVLTLLGLIQGKWLKGAAWFVTRAVPIATIVSASIVKLGDLLTKATTPDAAPAMAMLAHATRDFHLHQIDALPATILGIGGFGGTLLTAIWGGAVQGAITTGAHSILKNLGQWGTAGPRFRVAPGDPRGR